MMKRVLMLVLCALSFSLFPMNNQQLMDEAIDREFEVINRFNDVPKPLSMTSNEIKKALKPPIVYLVEPDKSSCGDVMQRCCIAGTAGCLGLLLNAFDTIKSYKEKRD